jgi:pimeloyl-ACP methyl ester carboxylesterase
MPPASKVPDPRLEDSPLYVDAGDRRVHVLQNMYNPRVVVFGNLLSDEECEALIELAKPRLARSLTVATKTGGEEVNEDRTSNGMFFARGESEVVRRIEDRIARLLNWPVENGEGLQVLHYRPGAEYKPHYDYFDPKEPGTPTILRRGGQRVGTLVMYLAEPEKGGGTTFPDVNLEVYPSAATPCSSATTGPIPPRAPARRRAGAGRREVDRHQVAAGGAVRMRAAGLPMKVQANGIPIEVEDTGEADRPAVLLVMGLGMQLVAWPEPLSSRLARRRVSRGALRQPRHRPVAALPAAGRAQPRRRVTQAPLRPAGARALHVAGDGGRQPGRAGRVAHPGRARRRRQHGRHDRAAPRAGGAAPRAVAHQHHEFQRRARPARPEAARAEGAAGAAAGCHRRHAGRAHDALLRQIGSPAFPSDETIVRERVRAAFRRSSDPAGVLRQMVAVAADGTRAKELATLRVPTLVVHGKDDPLVPFACGDDTARRIRGARLVAIAGMGHDLPPGVVDLLLKAVVPHLRQTGAR